MKSIFAIIALLAASSLGNFVYAESIQPTKVDAIPAGYKPADKTDEAELWYILDKIEADVKQSPRLIRDAALNKYVREVTCKVTGDYCKDLRIYILDVPYFNASMSPNGMMQVWSGALLRMQNEAELALVIGHEFGHYKNRHSLSQWRKMKKSTAFLATFGMLTAGTGFDMAANLIGSANLAKFSRDKEREADKIGFETIVNNGYDPFVGAQLWDRMLREEKAVDYGKPLPVFASHPQSKERRDDLQLAAQSVANPGKTLESKSYHANTDSYLLKWLDNDVSRRRFNSSLQAMSDMESGYPANKKGLFTFYRAEVHRRRNREGDKAMAATLYQQATLLPDPPAAAWREYGLTLKAANNKSEAAAALEKYLILSPDADDKAFIDQYVKEMKATP